MALTSPEQRKQVHKQDQRVVACEALAVGPAGRFTGVTPRILKVLGRKCCREACCLLTGECDNLTVEDCLAVGGTPQGEGTSCSDPDVNCDLAQACCFDDGNCADLPPAECVALGGVPQGKGTECADGLGCVFCAGSGNFDCVAPWEERGCPFSVVATFSEVVMTNNSQGTQCNSSEGGSIVYGGPQCIEATDFSCGYNNSGLQRIGDSDCDGDLWTSPGQSDVNILACGGFADCRPWFLRVALKCGCAPKHNQAAIDVMFQWTKHAIDGCVPRGDWGTVGPMGGGHDGSSARLVLS